MKEATSFRKIIERPFRPGGLARRIILRLTVTILVPILLIAIVAYLGTRQTFQNQIVNQMQNLVATEMDAARETMKIKQIRLDRIAHRTDFAASMIDGRTVMEVDPDGRSAHEVITLWNYISDRLEKNCRRTVFAAPNTATAAPQASRPVGGFGRRVVGS